MNSITGIDAKFRSIVRAVLDWAREFKSRTASEDLDTLYNSALDAVVGSLLARFYPPEFSVDLSANQLHLFDSATFAGAISVKVSDNLTPQEVGRLYEFLRGFRLDISSGNQPALIPSARGKRNSGLFYTPPVIVEHIVRRTLDTLAVTHPADYLDLKILDPAMGTGAFLAYALDELALRVLSNKRGNNAPGSSELARIQERIRERARELARSIEFTPEQALRIFIMSHCLYGVDLDPIAVKIAKVGLMQKAFGKLPLIPGLEPNIRVGNALMGEAVDLSSAGCDLDQRHARAYFGGKEPDPISVRGWRRDRQIFHWPLEFPEVFCRDAAGFDAVIGNPPYEILSVKESGILDRRGEQTYFRRTYRSCQGKINTYRLMMERGLSLLRNDGALGFIVPATLLADSTAEKLRRIILDETCILDAVVIPERAQVFDGVTQAFLILITRKGDKTESLRTALWDGRSSIPKQGEIEINRSIIDETGFRIPVIRSWEEKALLEALMRHPPLRGCAQSPRIARVHQGEVNLTVHREFITADRTAHPLIRGEHVKPFQLLHPSPGGHRLDWVLPNFLHEGGYRTKRSLSRMGTKESRKDASSRGNPWEKERIAIGRVVNMDAERRLKAAPVPAGSFLGDMTNSLTELATPQDFLLGLLNSSILNWRIKLTSTNNYLSAAEIEALPIPRMPEDRALIDSASCLQNGLRPLMTGETCSIPDCVGLIDGLLHSVRESERQPALVHMIQSIVKEIRAGIHAGAGTAGGPSGLWNLLDAAVLMTYGAESYAAVLDAGLGSGHVEP